VSVIGYAALALAAAVCLVGVGVRLARHAWSFGPRSDVDTTDKETRS
jgi:hypothetical protein